MDYLAFNKYKKWRKEVRQSNKKTLFNRHSLLKNTLCIIFLIGSIASIVLDALGVFNVINNGLQWAYVAMAVPFSSLIALFIWANHYYKNNINNIAKLKMAQSKKLEKTLKNIRYKTKYQLKQLGNRLDEKYKKENLKIRRIHKIIDNIFIVVFIPVNLTLFKNFVEKGFDLSFAINFIGYELTLLFAVYILLLALIQIYKIFICQLNIIEEMIEDIHYILDHFFPIDDNDV